MSEKLTDWFPADVTPVREGWYEREYKDEWTRKLHDYWDGQRWLLGDGFGGRIASAWELRRWRGLASNPEKKP